MAAAQGRGSRDRSAEPAWRLPPLEVFGWPGFGGREQPGGPRGLGFLKSALFLLADAGIGHGHRRRGHGLAGVLRAEDRAAEIAGERRAELRHAGIVLRQIGEAVRRRAVVGGIEFLTLIAAVPGLERVDQRAAEAEARDQREPGERLARQPGDARRLRPQPHGRGTLAGQRPGVIVRILLARRFGLLAFFLLGIELVAHDAGLPSVREMRTRFWVLAAPKRSSAAANSRSTTM